MPSVSNGNSGRSLETKADQLKSVVAVLAGVSAAAIARSHGDIDHFSGRDKVHYIFSLPLWLADQLAKKLLNGLAKHRCFVAWVHTVAVQFDEEPLRASANAYHSLSPKSKTVHCGRVHSCEFTILDAWKNPAPFAPSQIEHKRPLDH